MAFLTAGESVDRMATYCRIEQMLFGLLGGWVADLTEPTAKLAMLSTADHCAWRAQRWFEMLPTAPPGPDAFLPATVSERDVFGRVADAVGVAQGARLVVTFRLFLPALRSALIDHLERTSTVADGPIQRLLGIAITDLGHDLAAGEGPMELLLTSPGERTDAERIEVELARDENGIDQILRF